MAEYIEREVALEAQNKSMNLAECRKRLERIPAADVVPVRHGRWIVKGQDIYCSECNAESAYNPFGASKFSIYCPNCGALMDKDGDGE